MRQLLYRYICPDFPFFLTLGYDLFDKIDIIPVRIQKIILTFFCQLWLVKCSQKFCWYISFNKIRHILTELFQLHQAVLILVHIFIKFFIFPVENGVQGIQQIFFRLKIIIKSTFWSSHFPDDIIYCRILITIFVKQFPCCINNFLS